MGLVSDDTTNFSDEILPLVVVLAREVSSSVPFRPWPTPKRGDLVVETTFMGQPDPHAIGWLVDYGDAPYGEDDPTDGSVPMREVWDIVPLDPNVQLDARGVQRWENATFRVVPEWFVTRAGLVCPELDAA